MIGAGIIDVDRIAPDIPEEIEFLQENEILEDNQGQNNHQPHKHPMSFFIEENIERTRPRRYFTHRSEVMILCNGRVVKVAVCFFYEACVVVASAVAMAKTWIPSPLPNAVSPSPDVAVTATWLIGSRGGRQPIRAWWDMRRQMRPGGLDGNRQMRQFMRDQQFHDFAR